MATVKPSVAWWHYRLGHASLPIVHRVLSGNNLSCSKEKLDASVCDVCQRVKSHQLALPKSISVSKVPLELVFYDVWGHALVSIRRFKYYVSFIDDYNKFTWFYPLKHKTEVFHKFHDFQQIVERCFNPKILVVQTDSGGEYKNTHSFLSTNGNCSPCFMPTVIPHIMETLIKVISK
jgi:hypothetical protein